ncbi:shugoshin 2 [Prionailurus bengalensis]|uniref:shugoshin 2 n=1 Tax=Prionailurus bengalensis TaxID=37029 RepID=UPI001CA7FBBF|nr:shugoshin 2 [Prionailurus bengalensis]XP_043433356.1 shugoshin 2 [Prionailurus bengalensis]XP_043433358.1 shugoshin 2 [Prionailurus bengalensis]XP_043433359.1 shugoshin 2 [Prionailurus bengalensis]XP_043433360.1 shugoshin 2 [Prionailurus bengalensis]
MENPVMETSSLFTSGIKRHVKDRISKTGKLNVSLASKIKTKILNNSSIFKISLKHNNRALAQALSREKENSRRVTTEKTLLQKEVEKLNFENAFLRLKLNNLNKKLIEIEALMNNNLITAIEMSTLSEFHQSPFLLPSSKKKRTSKQYKLMRLPFARVPLTSNDDDDDDDDDKEKIQYDDNIIAKTSPDIPFSVSTRQSLSKNHFHSDQSSKNSLMSEIRNAQSISHRKEKPSPSNITERKKRVSSWESNNPSTDSLHVMDLGQQQISSREFNWHEINDCTNETNIKMQRNIQCLPDSSESTSEPAAEYMNPFQGSDDYQLQKTVYDADMDLTAGEVSKIVTVSTGAKNRSDKKSNDCEIKTFRKVKDSSSEKKRERSKRQFKNSSDIDIEEKIENGPEKKSVVVDGKGNSEDPNFIFSAEQLTQLNILKEVTLHNGFDQDDRESIQHNKKKKRIHVTNEQEETNSFSQSSDKFQQESKFDMGQSSVAYHKSKASRQTFVIHKLEKGNLFPNQKSNETTSENLEVTSEFQTADLSTKDNGSLCDYKTQNMSYLRKHVTDKQPTQQHQSKINEKLRQKVNRRTEIISESNQVYGDSGKDVYGPEKGNFSFQTQEDKETMSGNLEVSDEFQKPAVSTIDNGNLYDCEIQNVLDMQKQITNVYPVQQNESKVNKNLRQKVNRKTEIISEMNHLDNGKNVYCPEKGNSFFLTQKDKEIIPENLKDPSEFQTPALSTKDSRKLYDYETQNVLGVKKHIHDMQPTCQNESKIDKKLRQKVCRKTEIISEINQVYENNDKDIHDPEKDNLLSLTQKEKETIPENPEDLNEFQIADPSTEGNRNLCHETQNILGVKKHVTDMPLAKQNESKISKRLRQKVNRKTEIILEMNRVNELKKKGVHDPEEGNFFSVSQTDKETIYENLEVTSELQTAYLSTQNNGNLYDYETQNVLDLKKHVTDMRPAQQNESKINKKLRQKVNQKTEIISERCPIYGDNDKDVHDQESYINGLDFQVNKSKQILECQGIISGYSMEIDSHEKENCDQISNLYKLVKKHGKESSGKTTILAKGKKSILQLADSLQTSVSESGLKSITNEADSDPGKQQNPKERTTTLNEKKKNIPFVKVIKEGECQVRKVNKTASKSKKRKIFIYPSSDNHEVMQVISDTDRGISVESEQANEEKILENEKVVKMKPDFYTKAFESLSQVYSPNIQDSSFNSVPGDSVPLSISSSKNLIIKESFVLESSPIFQVTDDVHEKIKGMKFKVNQRTQKSEIGGRTLQDLTNTSFISNNTANAENKSENPSLELPSRRRRCTPLYLKEPNLKRKMRR